MLSVLPSLAEDVAAAVGSLVGAAAVGTCVAAGTDVATEGIGSGLSGSGGSDAPQPTAVKAIAVSRAAPRTKRRIPVLPIPSIEACLT